jgi:hypothetical protein
MEKNYCSGFLNDTVNKIIKEVYCSCCIEMCKLCKGPSNFEHTKKEVRNLIVDLLTDMNYLGRTFSKDQENEELISMAVCYFHEYNLENFLFICRHIHLRNSQLFFKLRDVLNEHIKCVDLKKFDDLEYYTDFNNWYGFRQYTEISKDAKLSFKNWLSLFMTKYEDIKFVEVEDIGAGFYKDSLGFILYTNEDKIIVHQKLDTDEKWRDLYPHEEVMALKLDYTLDKKID